MKKPKRNPDFALEQEGEIIRLTNLINGDEVEINQGTYLIWQLCDGQTRQDEMVALLSDAYPGSSSSIKNDVAFTLQELERLSLISNLA